MTTRIAFLPYGRKAGIRLAQVGLGELRWMSGQPDDLDAESKVGDLTPDDHLIVYPNKAALYAPRPAVRCKLSLLMAEPIAYHGRYYRMARLLHRRFHRVLTFNSVLVAGIPNSLFLPAGTTWVHDWRTLDLTKTADVSLIASAKAKLKGHKLRHAIVRDCIKRGAGVDVMGGGYKPFDVKSDGLAPYRYSVVIENSREPGYFTEKLVDSILCETIPIYWGAPDIANYFDPRGMMVCTSHDEIMDSIAIACQTDYHRRIQHGLSNKQAAMRFLDYEKNAAELLLADLENGVRHAICA